MIHGDDWKTNYLSKIREECFEVVKEWGGEIVEIVHGGVLSALTGTAAPGAGGSIIA